jgi:hypothetical protein
MFRMTNESGRRPDKERFQPIIIKDSLLGKIGMGLFCASVVAIIMNFAGLKWLVVHVFALFLSLFGRDVYDVKPTEAVKAAAHDTIDHYKGEARKAAGPVLLPAIGHATPEEIKAKAEAKEAERKRQEESDIKKFHARAAAVGLKYGEDWELEKLRVEVPLAEQRFEYDKERKVLLAQARELNLPVDDDLDNKTLKEEIKEEKAFQKADTDYQESLRAWKLAMERYQWNIDHGPNARCPNQRCRNVMRISSPKGPGQCKRCLGFFPRSQMIANWTPPPPPKQPLPPKRKPSLLKRIFG